MFAIASSTSTSTVIGVVETEKGYARFTADAHHAFWHVPIKEECYTDPPREWLAARKENNESTDVMWKLEKEWYGRRLVGQGLVEWLA